MERLFGEHNFIANIIWQKVYSPKGTAQHFSDDHEYIICYALNKSVWRPNLMPRTTEQDKAFKNLDHDSRGPWKAGDLSARNFYSKGTYPIKCPSGRVISGPPPGNYWRFSEDKFLELDRDNRIWWGKGGNNVPALKRFLSEVKQGVTPQTLWKYEEVGHTQDAKKELHDIFQFEKTEDVFSTPKPIRLIERILRIATRPGDLILDFFAGSGTTAHAVMKLNAEDGGDRRYILVSSTEATADAPDKNLCRDVCAERVRRVASGYVNRKGESVPGLGGGFAYLRARRIDASRVLGEIRHDEVWTALQLIHGQALRPYDDAALIQLGATSDGALLYVPRLTEASVAAAREALATAGTALIYSWQAALLEQHIEDPGASFEPIPHCLVRRFGLGRQP